MAGMLFILFLLACFWLLVLASWLAAWWARRRGRRGWPYGMAVILAAVGLLFWDWLPMEMSYKNKCENEAGLTVYKTPEQWQQENPGVWETLTPMPWNITNSRVVDRGSLRRHKLNERFAQDTYTIRHRFSVLEIRESIIDMKTNIPMVVYVDFITDFPSGELKLDSRMLRFWMGKGRCDDHNVLGWEKPRKFREHLRSERSMFLSFVQLFSGGSKK